MKKAFLCLIPVLLAAGGLLAVSPYLAGQSYGAPAAQEGNQPEPYTMTSFGPWNEGVAKSHVPQVTFEKMDQGIKVRVQIDNHPMDPGNPHYIMWIRIEDTRGNKLGEKMFKPTDPGPAVAEFELKDAPDEIKAFERCNIHGTWLNDVKVE
jgi:desulfoferrodoxin-like iron-binding protein